MSAKKKVATIYRRPKAVLPKVGQKIWVPSRMYLDRGEDDMVGGLGTIDSVRQDRHIVWVSVSEVPNHDFNLEVILDEQKELENEFGRRKPYPQPDRR